MAAITTDLMTVEEFRALPEDKGSVYSELHYGKVVHLTRPKFKHYRIQHRLCRLFEPLSPEGSLVGIELAFRALPEHELRAADVAWVNPDRVGGIDPEDNLRGAPDLVVEVLSRSNTVAELYDKEKLCLENGALEFWVVDPARKQVKVSTPDGKTVTWRSGDQIPLAFFGGASISVDSIFTA
jgi:Uma2 family endonuclease